MTTEAGTDDDSSGDAWTRRLDELGAAGWEAVGPVVLHAQPSDVRFLLMKRPREV